MKRIVCTLIILSLALAYSCSDDKDKKPIIGKFKWNGDWNDPTDTNYKPNGYNPLGGTMWRRKEITTFVVEYTTDFWYKRYEYDPSTKTLSLLDKHQYKINDKAYWTERYKHSIYKIEGDKMYNQQINEGVVPRDPDWKEYTRFYYTPN